MPGKSYSGPLPPLTEEEADYARLLQQHVRVLARDIGPRHLGNYAALERARCYITDQLRSLGYAPQPQAFRVQDLEASNIEAVLQGTDTAAPDVIIGAHYDTVAGTPGADDNASGVAMLLLLASLFRNESTRSYIRWVAFVNEEPPYFQTDAMGSMVYARRLREDGRRVRAMLSLECVGYFSDAPGSQQYPPPFGLFYPPVGNFIGFVGNTRYSRLVREVVREFRRVARIPSEGAAVPEFVPGVAWSDHWSFWRQGYPALMVTDTAPFRNPHYHGPTDTPDTLDYERMARVVKGLVAVIRYLAVGNAAA